MHKTASLTIEKYSLLKRGGRIVAALSGGPDSMALLFFLNQMKPYYGIELFAVHVNHMIRGKEADADTSFVQDYCMQNGIALYSVKKDAPSLASGKKLSLEEAGRILRREAYRESLHFFSADKIATGHNKNDNAETFLLMLSRGAGTKGLSGIAPYSHADGMSIIRPLIDCSRTQIETYCEENNIPFVTDKTNLEACYTRNKIRLNLIPWLENNLNNDIIGAITGASEIIREQTEFIEALAQDAYANCLSEQTNGAVSLNIVKLNKNGEALKKLIIREAIRQLKGNIKDISRTHINDIMSLSLKGTGKHICLPDGIECDTIYDTIVFSKKTDTPSGFCYRLSGGVPVYVKERDIYVTFSGEQLNIDNFKNLCTKMFKCDKIFSEVCYRTRQPGDRIKLKHGTKKLSDYFIDKKVPKAQRDEAALIADGSDVLSIPGVCDSERVKYGGSIFYIQFWEVDDGNTTGSNIH